MPNIGIICSDAGGANIILNYIKSKKTKNKYFFYLKGNAKYIFNNSFNNFKNTNLSLIKKKCKIIYFGTSTGFFEKRILKRLKKNFYCISFLDNWRNYLERFKIKQDVILPNEIYVFDKLALTLAKKTFKKYDIKITLSFENYILKQLQSSKNSSSNDLLYLTDPSKTRLKDIYNKGYNEKQALNYFFVRLNEIQEKNFNVIIKVHPSENVKKYRFIKKLYSKHNFEIIKNENPVSLIKKSKITFGCKSSLLYYCLISNKKVICVIPPSKGVTELPTKKIKYLRDLNTKNFKKILLKKN